MYPFERFTAHAKKTLTMAHEEAVRHGGGYIGTEHLLLGLLRVEDGAGGRALRNQGMELATIRALVEAAQRKEKPVRKGAIVPTSRVKRVIELAFDEARRRGSASVGSRHLLMGLLVEPEGVAGRVLRDQGVDLNRIEQELRGMAQLGTGPGDVMHAQEAFFIWLKVGSRVLYHDPEPPYRLWEARAVEHDTVGDPPSLNVKIEIEGHPTTPQVVVPAGQLHRIPLTSTAGCQRCLYGQPS
jgi:Clp amino terminal domain, pathogenicity island component